MTRSLTQLCCAVLVVLLFPSFVIAQVTSTLSGTVVDSAGAVIPGASVVVTNKSTTATFNAVTDGTGTFAVPALNPGLYSVTVSLSGFKTALLDDVRLQPGIPSAIKATLEVGGLEETVVVSGGETLINTTTPVIAATLNVDQINDMPLPTRNALNAVTFLAGVNTSGINRDSNVNGLPESFINITLDGVANNDQFNKTTDGFFAMVTPRQDAVEAVTVTMGVGGADVGGHGAIGINFVTRSGSNRFTGSAYEYHRSPRFNSNYWFNIRNNQPKNDVVLNQYGARQGGPILIPGMFDGRNKAFFFANYEEVRLPNNFTRTRTVLDPRAQQGWFRYNVTVGGAQQVREVNVLQLAAANGHLSTMDPTISRVLGLINDSARQDGALLNLASDPLLNDFVWQSPGRQTEKQPVVRLDFNLSQNHRLSFTNNQLWVVRDPDQLNNSDRRFPLGTNYGKYVSSRPSRSMALRSTLSANLVSELRGGITRGGGSFFGQPETNGVDSFADTNGFALDLDAANVLGAGLTNWHVENEPTWRSGYSYSLDETLTWMKGKHSITTGASVFLGRTWANGQVMVPEIDIAFEEAQDPANAMFTTGNFQGASSAQLTDARALYALLTGRVRGIVGEAALSKEGRYEAFGPRYREGKMDEYSAFIQDAWRVTPTLTINAGVRWDVQMPFSASNDIMSAASLQSICGISGLGAGDNNYNACNFFRPGASGGVVPQFDQLKKGTLGYNTDWNNIAPNVGLAWRPNRETGFWRKILGDPDQATIRAGYSVSYERQGLGVFTGQFGENPGSTLSLTRDQSTGIVGAGETWPVLLREQNRLFNAPFPTSPSFPIVARPNRADNIEGFHPDIEVASARTFTVSLQRAITSSTALEVRYVGTLGRDQWSELNWNERNVVENGFLDEFKLAMQNLQANNAAGRTGSFAYFGPGTGTHPLPIYLAYLNGSRDANNPAAYTGGANTWTNSTLAGRLVRTNPLPNNVTSTSAYATGNAGLANAAADLDNSLVRRNNALAAGYPANFFVVNPHINQVNINDSGAFSSYHAIQAEVRRRLSRGLQANASYQYALEEGSSFLGFHVGRASNPTNGSVRHAIKTQWDWTLPVGRGERFGRDINPILNGFIGGWQFNGVGRIQARTADFGNVRLVGMTKKDLQKMYKWDVRVDPATGLRTVYSLPDDVILNTRRAFSSSSTSLSGYSDLGVPEGRYIAPPNSADCIQVKAGDCAPRTTILRSPFFTRFDIGVTKRFPIAGRVNFELRADVLNVFDNINFNVTDASRQAGTAATIFQTNAAYTDLNNTFDPGGRIGQLVFRLNW